MSNYKRKEMCEPTADAVVQTEENAILRLKGLLYAALKCIYIQSGNNLILSIGGPCDYEAYTDVLSQDEMHHECGNGFLADSRVKNKPMHGKSHASVFMERDHISACVHANWILAHLFVVRGKFTEAVNLAERASETMLRVSSKIKDAALALAEKLGVSGVLEADSAAEKALVLEHEMKVTIPRLPWDIKCVSAKHIVPREAKDEARIVFEEAVTDVFSNGVCIANEEWDDIDEVMLCATGLSKRYDEMTDEERVSSGSVVLRNIIRDLQKDDDGLASAIAASLVAARALAWNARRLEEACKKVQEEAAAV